MNRQTDIVAPEKAMELQIQENITKWQSGNDPLAPLSNKQLDLIYEVRDHIKGDFYDFKESSEESNIETSQEDIPYIDSTRSFTRWLVEIEKSVRYENIKDYQRYYEILNQRSRNSEGLFQLADDTLGSLDDLKSKYNLVVAKTDSLHNLSDQLMKHQKILKDKRNSIREKLQHFITFDPYEEYLDKNSNRINTTEYIKVLEKINNSISYLGDHLNYKEARTYKLKYEILLNSVLNRIYRFFHNVINDTIKQVLDPETKTDLVPIDPSGHDSNVDSAFSLYYGKFQSAALKVKMITSHLEERENSSEQYKNIIFDCHKTYFSQRLPILSVAVAKTLHDLKEKHKNDYSILFRSCSLFIMKICQDEARCFYYFFTRSSPQLDEYLSTFCQQLYDILRPSLILINHLEILCELCGILRKELLNDKVIGDDYLTKYVDTVQQLLQDVEERLVFRTNIFFQHDLNGYQPSPGDLAYPEKLEQMENIAFELHEIRADSRSSVASADSQEVSNITATPVAQFRSYTGNSPADLHGMWYPTVKRTLVCLSRLYFCLDQETFQGLAQEALAICVRTVDNAAKLIASKKTNFDGRLFQIKHLLIIREQIAPFQVDFTVKEVALDFSVVQKAAFGLINKRDKLFTFGSNNALLEFLLDGTPRVREYLVDSRKEIDKHLKHACEAFILNATQSLIGSMIHWMQKVEEAIKKSQNPNATQETIPIRERDFSKPEVVAEILCDCMKRIRTKVPSIQRSMQLYLANRETEFILFRPIKNNVINAFIQIDQLFSAAKYTEDDRLLIACPSGEQVNVLICSVSLLLDQDGSKNTGSSQ